MERGVHQQACGRQGWRKLKETTWVTMTTGDANPCLLHLWRGGGDGIRTDARIKYIIIYGCHTQGSKHPENNDGVCMLRCVPVFVTPWTVALQSPLSMGFSRQGTLEWVAISSSWGSSQSRDWTPISCISRWVVYHCATWEAYLNHYLFLNCSSKFLTTC